MNDTVKDAIDAELEEIEPVRSHDAEPHGYGSDISCDRDVDARVTELDGFDPLVLAQALVRRLDCPRGALPDDPTYGIDLRGFLNRGATLQNLRSLSGQIRLELTKDDRVSSVTVRVTADLAAKSLAITVRVVPVDALEAFTLVLSATSSAVLLEEIRSEG